MMIFLRLEEMRLRFRAWWRGFLSRHVVDDEPVPSGDLRVSHLGDDGNWEESDRSWRTCARPSCVRTFEKRPVNKRFCSAECRERSRGLRK